jgi:hypothetical protein
LPIEEGNRWMIGCNENVILERLRQLLDACDETAALAARLAMQAPAGAGSLCALLRGRSEDYRRSSHELAECLQTLPQADAARPAPALAVVSGADVASAWEAAECEALILFRDALDAELPANAEEVVIRHIDDGVHALERLRELRRRLSPALGQSRFAAS